MMLVESWRPIAEAATDGPPVILYVAEREGLPAFQCVTKYHPDAGWTVDELREATHFVPMLPAPGQEPPPIPAFIRRAIDALALSLPMMEHVLGDGHPPATAMLADAIRHYGEASQAVSLWQHWKASAGLVEAFDHWQREVMPAPSGGRARTRD